MEFELFVNAHDRRRCVLGSVNVINSIWSRNRFTFQRRRYVYSKGYDDLIARRYVIVISKHLCKFNTPENQGLCWNFF